MADRTVTQEEIEAFLEDLKQYVTFTVETTDLGGDVASSQSTTLAGGCDDVYKRHPKIRIALRRAVMVLGKRNLQRLRAERALH